MMRKKSQIQLKYKLTNKKKKVAIIRNVQFPRNNSIYSTAIVSSLKIFKQFQNKQKINNLHLHSYIMPETKQ